MHCTRNIDGWGACDCRSAYIRRIQSLLPEKGKVSILIVTDKQYATIQIFWGAVEKKRPIQLQLDFFDNFAV